MRLVAVLIALAVLGIGHAWADCPSGGMNWEGCPFNRTTATAEGRFVLSEFPQQAEQSILDYFNHTYAGCRWGPADEAVGAYSPYSNGIVYFLKKGVMLHREWIDRAMLRDLLAGKIVLTKYSRTPCAPKKQYQPPVVHYEVPHSRFP